MAYPAEIFGVVDLGNDVFILWDRDGRGFAWHHPTCRVWAPLRLMSDPASTGHALVSGGANDTTNLTIRGSLLCPMGCGSHGYIENGKWRPA